MPPVYHDYFADPFVWKAEEGYFAVGTQPSTRSREVFPLLFSHDLREWRYQRNVLSRLDPGYGDTYWAPEVAEHEGKYYLYYSVGFSDKLHHLRVAIASSPDGPYEDTGRPLNNPFTCPFAIDAHPFRDDDGQWYLFYARDFLDLDGTERVGTGLVVDKLENMTALAGRESAVQRAHYDWQLFKRQRVMYGGRYDWHTLEGPAVRKYAGKYYCLYSGGCWENDTYGVDFVVSDKITGPYSDFGQAESPRILKSSGKLSGPGHVSLVRGESDDMDYIVFHAWDAAGSRREMHISSLEWGVAGPRGHAG